MSRLIFVNRFYWPEEPATSQLLTDLAEHLASQGHGVTIIASRSESVDTPRRELHNGVDIRRVGSTRLGRTSAFKRIADYVSFAVGACWQLILVSRRGDRVVLMTDPPMLGAVIWPWLTLRRIRFFHWIQDIYPEIAVELTGCSWLHGLRPLRNLAWRRAACCITLGQDMARIITRANVPASRIRILPNWAPSGLHSPNESDVAQLRDSWQLTGKFVAMYSGNLGRVHDLQSIIELAAALRTDPDIVFVFIGRGAQLASLQTIVAEQGLPNVRFQPPQPRTQLARTLGLGDVHFVTLRQGCESFVFPSKLYGIAAVGRPLAFIGPQDSELARQVVHEGLGLSFDRDNTTALAQSLRALKDDPKRQLHISQAARRFTQRHDITQALQAWDQLLHSDSDLAASPHVPHSSH